MLALVLGGVAVFPQPKPCLYQGKTVRQWVSLLDMDTGQKKQRDEASWALVQIGADGDAVGRPNSSCRWDSDSLAVPTDMIVGTARNSSNIICRSAKCGRRSRLPPPIRTNGSVHWSVAP